MKNNILCFCLWLIVGFLQSPAALAFDDRDRDWELLAKQASEALKQRIATNKRLYKKGQFEDLDFIVDRFEKIDSLPPFFDNESRLKINTILSYLLHIGKRNASRRASLYVLVTPGVPLLDEETAKNLDSDTYTILAKQFPKFISNEQLDLKGKIGKYLKEEINDMEVFKKLAKEQDDFADKVQEGVANEIVNPVLVIFFLQEVIRDGKTVYVYSCKIRFGSEINKDTEAKKFIDNTLRMQDNDVFAFLIRDLNTGGITEAQQRRNYIGKFYTYSIVIYLQSWMFRAQLQKEDLDFLDLDKKVAFVSKVEELYDNQWSKFMLQDWGTETAQLIGRAIVVFGVEYLKSVPGKFGKVGTFFRVRGEALVTWAYNGIVGRYTSASTGNEDVKPFIASLLQPMNLFSAAMTDYTLSGEMRLSADQLPKDQIFDLIAHYHDEKFDVYYEKDGSTAEKKDLDFQKFYDLIKDEVLQSVPVNWPVRFLSCSSLTTAQELANLLKRKIIASDGVVILYHDGTVESPPDDEWFEIDENGKKSDSPIKNPTPPSTSTDKTRFVRLGVGKSESKIVQGVSEISLNRLKNRFLGLKDRTTGEIRVKVFGSRTKGTHRPESDLDICILAEDISVFETDRGVKIVQTILEDFFIETGIKVDLNIITPSDMPHMKFSWSDLKDF